MFKSTPVQIRKRHLSTLKGHAATGGLSIVTFGNDKPESKSVIIAVQGNHLKVEKFIGALIDDNACRRLPAMGPVAESTPNEEKIA